MTTPDPATTPPAKKTSAVVRVGRIFLTIIAVLILASAIFGKKDKDSAAPDSAAAKPASAPASKPTNDASPTASKPLIMEKAKAFVGGGEWEEFVEGGFKLLVPGRSRDFKAARVSGIHEVTVRNVRSTRGSEGERFATSIVVYLDDSFRDANGRYREYVLIANWIALVESWVKSVPVSDQSKAAAVRYMEDKLVFLLVFQLLNKQIELL